MQTCRCTRARASNHPLPCQLSMVHDTRLAIAVASALSCCGGARAFVASPLQHQPQQQLPLLQQHHVVTGRRENTAVSPLAVNLPWPLGKLLPWGRETPSIDSGMSIKGDDRHWAPSKRNRYFIAAEMKTWLTDEKGQVLEIASGTGCHVEAFAKELPGWTFQPTEVGGACALSRCGYFLWQSGAARQQWLWCFGVERNMQIVCCLLNLEIY